MIKEVAVLVLVLISTTTTQSTYYAELEPSNGNPSPDDTVTLQCSTNLPVDICQWEINGVEYEATHLPLGFTTDGLNLVFQFRTPLLVRCSFRLFGNEKPFSNTSHIGLQGQNGLIAGCSENVTFSNNEGASDMNMRINVTGRVNCEMMAVYKNCDNNKEFSTSSPINKPDIILRMEDVQSLYGNNVTVTTTEICDECNDVKYFLPNMTITEHKKINRTFDGNLIEDISSHPYKCRVVDYTICISSQGTIECFIGDCGKRNAIYTSQCDKNNTEKRVSLIVNGSNVENKAVVSIFCESRNVGCSGDEIELVMLFNFEILLLNDAGTTVPLIALLTSMVLLQVFIA